VPERHTEHRGVAQITAQRIEERVNDGNRE
jgi:hypothetical protein